MLVFDLFGNRFTAAGAWDTILLWLTSGDAGNIILGLLALALAVVFVGGIVALSLWKPAHGMMLLVALWLMGFIDRNPTSYYGVRMSAVDAAVIANRLGGDVDIRTYGDRFFVSLRAQDLIRRYMWCPSEPPGDQNSNCKAMSETDRLTEETNAYIKLVLSTYPSISRDEIVRALEQQAAAYSFLDGSRSTDVSINGDITSATEAVKNVLTVAARKQAALSNTEGLPDSGYISLEDMGWPDTGRDTSASTSDPPGLSFEEWLSEDLNSSPQTVPSRGIPVEDLLRMQEGLNP